jgi:hypothetical protein
MAPTNANKSSSTNDMATNVMIVVYIAIVASYYKTLKVPNLLISLGLGCLLYAFEMSTTIAISVSIVSFLLLVNYNKEGFDTNASTGDIKATIRTMKARKEFTVEGYEDVKKEKDEKPAPAKELQLGKDMPMPFKLGEIPSQAKNGPHIDAASTLVKAINSLDPDQINAMSKDTQQLIDTQKSLMGMLGNMKPMLNDGKELMETFQQMFGK